MRNLLKKIPAKFKGEVVNRVENCRFCGENSGILIAKIDYWDIKSTSIVKCENCELAQLDPMLTEEETSKGCLAYYIEESLRTSTREQERNLIRNFRRGILFAFSLKKLNYNPTNVLEFGPGSGYFLQGLKFVFPQARVTVIDINQEVLNFNNSQHQYETIQSSLEDLPNELFGKFDLIISRDIIEHVIDISKVIESVKKCLTPNGLFHFITPNGHEDVWKHYLTYNHLNKNAELLINHVNYFDGKGLLDHLAKLNFSPIEYYTYKFKTTRRGSGWKVKPKLMAAISQKKSADYYINKIDEVRKVDFNKNEILNKWWIKQSRKHFAYWISWFNHANFLKADPTINVGHEIYGLFK